MKLTLPPPLRLSAVLALGLLVPATHAVAQPAPEALPPISPATTIRPATAEACRLLDDAAARGRMDGLLLNLAASCNRRDLMRQPPARETSLEESTSNSILAVDVQVNNSAGENGTSTTQSETSIAYNETTGTLCSAFNDSWEFFGSTGGGGFTGFSRSTDGGVSWVDQGAVGSTAMGDPSLVWRRSDGKFYLATLESGGALSLWRSDNDCDSFVKVGVPSTGNDDKEILAVDNNPASAHYGNLYLVWTDFGAAGTPIRAARSTNGGVTWSNFLNLSAAGTVQGAWPAVAPNGTIVVAWLRYASWPAGNITVEVARSTNGGVSYALVTSPQSNAVSPRDNVASTNCGRPALRGDIRYLASPQVAYDANNVLHIVYSRDPNTFNSGDAVNVYYRRSTDHGTTWGAELLLNDDGTTRDQYFPTVQARGSLIVATWYDRRNDANNVLQDYYKRSSNDGGLTWGASERVSDVNSPIRLDPNLAACYHGDYDQSVITPTSTVVQWADDRNFVGTRNDPDVWSDRFPNGRNGMTWSKVAHSNVYGTDHVGCTGCNPYTGDTACSTALPILCIKPDGAANPGLVTDYYNGWAGGNIGLTPATLGTSLGSLANANALCANFFGPGYRIAEFHDGGGGWSWFSRGNVRDTGRFWVYINDQSANCWN